MHYPKPKVSVPNPFFAEQLLCLGSWHQYIVPIRTRTRLYTCPTTIEPFSITLIAFSVLKITSQYDLEGEENRERQKVLPGLWQLINLDHLGI